MSNLCIITARGGSKRIPHKNIRPFAGKPIIAYSIEAALQSELFDEVMVSTDDTEIAGVASIYGANVPFMRSEETSGDFASTADVVYEVLQNYQAAEKCFESFCCLYPTAPFVTPEKLQGAAVLLNECDTVLSVVRFSFPPQRGMVESDGSLTWWQPENELVRSQDLEPIYHDAGQFYFRDVNHFLETGKLISGRVRCIEVPNEAAQDIDTESDWEIAEMKYERMMSRG